MDYKLRYYKNIIPNDIVSLFMELLKSHMYKKKNLFILYSPAINKVSIEILKPTLLKNKKGWFCMSKFFVLDLMDLKFENDQSKNLNISFYRQFIKSLLKIFFSIIFKF